eukprot:288281-Prorocentrum_minimum.AAC.2
MAEEACHGHGMAHLIQRFTPLGAQTGRRVGTPTLPVSGCDLVGSFGFRGVVLAKHVCGGHRLV